MKTLKSILSNPFLLGAQGFLAGAILVWSGSDPVEPIGVQAPTAAMAQARVAS